MTPQGVTDMRGAPVCMAPGWDLTHSGIERPANMEKPMMKRLREELMSTYWRLDRPTATIIPEIQIQAGDDNDDAMEIRQIL